MTVRRTQTVWRTADGQTDLVRVDGPTVSVLPYSVTPGQAQELIEALEDACELLKDRGVVPLPKEAAHV